MRRAGISRRGPITERGNGRTGQSAARRPACAADAAAGRDCRPRAGGDVCALSPGPQSRAAAGGGDAGGSGAGARRRGHRQDPRADDAHRPHPRHRTRARRRHPGGHLHQQGRAGNETARRRHGRADRGGHALAGHVPFDRREDSPPPCRVGRPEARLHHPRPGRSDPPAQAAVGSGEHRREAMARARARGPHRQLEEPRAHPRPGARRRGRELCRRPRQEALYRLPGAAEGAQRRRLRRSLARMHPPVPRAERGAASVSGAVPIHLGRRVSGHQRGAVSVAAPAGAEYERAGKCHTLSTRSVTLSPRAGRGWRAKRAG